MVDVEGRKGCEVVGQLADNCTRRRRKEGEEDRG